MVTRRALIKSLGIGPGGGAEVTLQETVASEIIPMIRQKCFIRQIADKAKTLINMTRPKIRVPKMVRAQGAYAVKSGQPAPEFKARLDSVPLEPEKIMAWLPIDSEVFEDSTIKDIEGILKEEMAREFAQAEEIAFLLGDTEINHGDGDPRNVYDGLFKQAAVTPYVYDNSLDASDGTAPVSNIIRALANLGIYGRNKRELVIMVGTGWEQSLIRNKAFQTMSAYAYGTGAGVFTGEIGRIGGAPVVATTFLDAQPGETHSKALVMHQSAFAIGDWQKFTINTYNEILSQTDQVAIRARERIAFTVRYAEAICEILNVPAFL